jgi:chemotaxis protein histidine kinase CheA/ActR/RegA family two-component response regulator
MINLNDLAEEQLQQELREMFFVDTQQQLEAYFDLTQLLNPCSWVADIQHIYRAIHTIKGGAVTVAANEMMQAATVLEDLLSDLRYLEVAPPLADGQLSQILLEAGELLASCLGITETGQAAVDRSQRTIQRLNFLHAQVKELFIPDWNEMKQVHQEFAEQGFGLVVLELEMAVHQLSTDEAITTDTMAIGNSMLDQLRQIGQDLDLAEGWTTLIQNCQELMDGGNSLQWRSLLPAYLVLLQQCAKNSGVLPLETVDDILSSLAAPAPDAFSPAIAIEPEEFSGFLGAFDDADIDDDLEIATLDLDDDDWFTNNMVLVEQLPDQTILDSGSDLGSIDEYLLDQQEDNNDLITLAVTTQEHLDEDLAGMLDDFFDDPGTKELPKEQMSSALITKQVVNPRRNIQIPVPLNRLDRSAQQVVATLLTTRGVTGQSQKLRSQLAQLTTITAESAQFTTKLRQLQDDHALLRQINSEQETANNLTLERYRQGYATINRLLENVLRMSELGREIETSTRQTFDNLALLDRQIFSLKDDIELNRLVPFRNLTMRARAILRDLTNRYGKAVELVVKNDQIELDAGVVQQFEPALLHLLRNAYDHGIESADERLAAGKPAQGQITLALQRRGNLYRLIIQDDGRGMNADDISVQAQSRGFIQTATSTNDELLAVISQPGFSSRNTINEMSGRGVGMDVVANQIMAIGGKMQLLTQLGVGSTFTIEVPAIQLLVSCVLLQVGDRTIALPTEEILETVLLSVADIQLDVDQCHWQISTYQCVAQAFSLAAYWHQFSTSLPDTAIALRCRLADQSAVWLIADDLLEQSQLLINPLPSPLVPPVGMLGVSLQPDGSLISVLDPVVITQSLQSRSIAPIASPAVVAVPVTTILIVDDAALMRRRLSASLTGAGFAVQACGDGLEALQWLQANDLPAIMITDVEMPNMDGLTLIDRCRSLGIQIPILVVSSRLSEDWGKEAQRVGANEFLNKGFTTNELLNIVENLLTNNTLVTI